MKNQKSILYLNIIWHQHQPLYLDPESDQLQGPWVRTHATKDYYDMTSIAESYPNIHFTVNLTSSLLYQLQECYVNRLSPFLDKKKNRIQAEKYFKKFGGKTDPWIDLALKPTAEFSANDKKYLLTNVWNAFGISDVMIVRFPQYQALQKKYWNEGAARLTEQDMREIKFWFYAAYFDPDFYEGQHALADGSVLDLTDLLMKNEQGCYFATRTITEDDCNRIIAETVKVMAAIVPLHKKLMYRPAFHKGQIEVITTPYYHPILPLIYDSDLARTCQPLDPMPSRFNYPQDAEIQVAKSVAYFKKIFGVKPNGMWPGEGSVAGEILPVFARQGISWIATDEKILNRSNPGGRPCYYPYTAAAGNGKKDNTVLVFRETELSDKIGFVYKNYYGEDAANDFIGHVLRFMPPENEPDRLLTVILDGENAWEWYRFDNDGKTFQNALYRKLSELYTDGRVITTTVTEYLKGNPKRNIASHAPKKFPKIEWLWPGSWINANYDTWIGESEENQAWEYLLIARQDLDASGLPQPDPKKSAPRSGTKEWYIYRAWESLYAAEGSDWFWWYGTDQNAPSGERPFDLGYITHLKNIYRFAEAAGGKMPARNFLPIGSQPQNISNPVQQGTMVQSKEDLVTVLFQCAAQDHYVRKSLYIAGNHELLGSWVPNRIRLYDDGTHGDQKENDGIWTLALKFPAGTDLEYKYTNSGGEGNWNPGEEFAYLNRKVRVERTASGIMVLLDTYGKI
jgi:alpha-amylase/alpha-mannosidase (GH57 family)